jgi:hypothetical protein
VGAAAGWCTGSIQGVDGARPPIGGERLADSLGAVERHGRQCREELIELCVDDTSEVPGGHNPNLLFRRLLPVEFDGICWTMSTDRPPTKAEFSDA